MLRRISVLLLSALLTVGLTASVAMANTSGPAGPNPDLSDRGQPNADEDKVKGKPHDPDAWGSVASALGDAGVMGEHSSNPFVSPADQTALPQDIKRETPRDGLGNVASNDLLDHGTTGSCSDVGTDPKVDPDNCDTGDNVSDHACVAAAAPLPGILPEVQPDCAAEPGGNRGPGSE